MTRRALVASLTLALGLGAGLMGCVTRPVDSLPPDVSKVERNVFPARPNDKVDILFVVDNSGSMAQEQENLGRNFANFVAGLKDDNGQPFDYRIAVASTDVGVGGQPVDPGPDNLCNSKGENGDGGELLAIVNSDESAWERSNAGIFACGDPGLGIDPTDPELCDQLTNNRQWLLDNCNGQAPTDNPWITNNKDDNRPDDEVATQFRCIASLGVNGCFVEQPLEAARQALDKNKNTFIRKEAFLAVIFITDEIDCSMKNTALVDPNDSNFNSPVDVGFRCYVDAYNCTGETTDMTTGAGGEDVTYFKYTKCEENTQWLKPLDDYKDFFQTQIKGENGAGQVIMAGITGNPDYTDAPNPPNGPGAQDANVAFVWERHEQAGQQADFQSNSCASVNGGAAPSTRIYDLLKTFPNPMTNEPTFVSICSGDFKPALEQLAQRISTQISTICVTVPPEAAADPNSVCALDELDPNGGVITGGIPSSDGWEIIPDSPGCAASPNGTSEIKIDPGLRGNFAVTSQLAVTCAGTAGM